ncbi:threonine synthase [Saxibacter everestensis]|uniref:Threonine synthase n=1 Tax=Saxibacter everestensis TaxID=2909229 RepID=A0ABY8QY84_9MICO|nr:threonine synthase [Brevibacteriaceae bacterium ZFBP1038]
MTASTSTTRDYVPSGPFAGRFGPAIALKSRETGRLTELGPFSIDPETFGPLEVAYDFGPVTRKDIEAGPASLWRYAPLLPVPRTAEERPADLSPGWTRLLKSENLARRLNLKNLWIKDDRDNPTHSFKDRVVATALAAAKTLGYTTLSCASTGNLANAVAAASARAGIDSVVFIPENLEQGKILTSAAYGTKLIAIKGNYDDVNRLCSEIADDRDDYGFVNVNLRAYYAEGSKTLGYEIAEQLGWRLPDQVVIPVASGSLLTKVDKAFQELIALGLVEAKPYRIFGAQATGCSPVAEAFDAGWDVAKPVRPDTIAKSLAIGNPADAPFVLDIVRRTGGAVAAVSDAEIVAGIRLLAETEGVFAETAGGVTVANLVKLLDDGRLDPDAETVVINTGDGLKTLDAIADHVGPAATIDPDLRIFRQTIAAL